MSERLGKIGVVLVAIFLLSYYSYNHSSGFFKANKEGVCFTGIVRKVYDGDTLGVFIFNTSRYEKIRLKYVDYIDLEPQNRVDKWLYLSNASLEHIERCYHEGIEYLRNMIENRYACVVQEHEGERDKYGRLLGYVDAFVDDKNKTKMDVGLWIIEQGYAIPYLRFGKGERAGRYIKVYEHLKKLKGGCLWSG